MSSSGDHDRDDEPSGFLSRWSRRKAQIRQGQVPTEPVPAAPTAVPLTQSAQAVDARRPVAATPAATEPVAPAPTTSAISAPAPAPVQADPLPTMDDVAKLPRGAEVRRFVAPGVSPEVRNAALKNLFADPHFNIMDGLDTYIDDYGKPDPLPAGMLRQMVQSQMLGLFKDEEPPAPPEIEGSKPRPAQAQSLSDTPPDPAPAPPTAVETAPDEDPDLRLQPHHAAGPGRPAPGAEPDPGRQR